MPEVQKPVLESATKAGRQSCAMTAALPSEDVLREHAYLVARGVRLLALVGHCESDPLTMLRAATQLEALADPNSIAFVIERGDGTADFGYASASWVIDLYRWLASTADAVPPHQQDRILGVLCGYSAEAIRDFEERRCGRLFRSPSR